MTRAGPPQATNLGASTLSRASAGRFSLYLRFLETHAATGAATISSGSLGEAVGVTASQVRKDLAQVGSLGHPGVGYPIAELIGALRLQLGLNRQWAVVVVGVGNLARALLRYRGFRQQGFRIVGLIDSDPGLVGQEIDGLRVRSVADMPATIAENHAELALLAVPAESAQEAADALVACGIRGILNFAPAVLRLPAGVRIVAIDLAAQLQQLAFLVQTSGADPVSESSGA